ncbi:UDP-4-amino-4,6-dideoxy-N-acetyl-beta-L-altrosamine N-acetyltransferase [Oceanospirillaceae bacterium]|nr:UDP-4-amino-4,6-dideoxy-N-acetyl-beta-L-altrosamine N-acetyltransferase [Oceanospirillaceae bacterium]
MKSIKLRPLKKKHLDMVFEWRNRIDVRKNMYTSHEITKEEHLSWFERIDIDTTKSYFIFELDNKPCGVIGFVDINLISKSSSWAFYSGDTASRGVGSLMEITALDYAFKEMELEKLYCEVLEFNDPVIKFHKKHGFKQEGIFKKHHFFEGKFWDVHRLAIFKNDWEKCRGEIVNRIKGPYSCGAVYRHKFHFYGDYAKKCDFESKLACDLLVTSVFSKVFGTVFPGDGSIYMKQSFNFHLPTHIGAELEATFKVISKVGRKLIVKTSITNSKTSEVVIDGEAEILISKEKSLEAGNE